MKVWKAIDNFPAYEVSNHGDVRRILGGQGAKAGKFIKWHLHTSNGYPDVRLRSNGVVKSIHVHKLVGLAFIGERKAGMQIRHLDGNKKNNHISNLVYGTAKENGEDNARLGVMRRGENVNTSVITEDQAKKCIDMLNQLVSPSVISCSLNIPKNVVYKIKHKKTWVWLQQATARAEGRATE